jgi:uncharacterized protein YcbX
MSSVRLGYRRAVLTVSALARYPVKSCRGEALDEAIVEPWGLAGDRRWMVVDADGEVITAREVHQLLLVRPQLVPDGLGLAGPDLPLLPVPVPDGRERMLVDIWGSQVDAACADPAADAWFTKLVGSTARLVYLDDPLARPTNPQRTRPDDRVSFADGYPLLLTTQASLDRLNEHIAEGPRADEGPLPMTRFRPSVVVEGAPAWAEDDWRELRIGGVPFRAVKGCDRCVLTTLDPDTAAKGMEPITTLARHRRFDGKTWFGINLVPDTHERRRIRVGDEIEIISAVAPGGGPLR